MCPPSPKKRKGDSGDVARIGLSPRLRTLDDIQILDRFMEPIKEEDALTDLLWSFPSDEVSTFAPSTLCAPVPPTLSGSLLLPWFARLPAACW